MPVFIGRGAPLDDIIPDCFRQQPVCHIKPPSAECAFRCGFADFAKAATQIATSVDRSTVV